VINELLPDNILLEIFDCYRAYVSILDEWEWGKIWPSLAHVCRRWRYTIFGSPLRLGLYLYCTATTPVKKTLDVWPPLPIKIYLPNFNVEHMDNVIAALEHRDRVCDIWLPMASTELACLATMMQEPFPALTNLRLWSHEVTQPVLPVSFLGGSAPRLQYLALTNFPFPTLPKLLLSTADLVHLQLNRIPHGGYISPEAMATALSALTRLKYLNFEFVSLASRPDRTSQRPLPFTRAVLPSLQFLQFRGVSEYFEDLVARIDAPVLEDMFITFFNQLIFDIRHLPRLIHHAGILGAYSQVEIAFRSHSIEISVSYVEGTSPPKTFILMISCRMRDWQVSSMAQICAQFRFLLSSVEQLNIRILNSYYPPLEVDMDSTQWLELLHPFTAVRTLRISAELQSLIVPALQDLSGELTMGVLPALERVYLEGYKPSGAEQQDIEAFIAARQGSHHPVSVHCWERPELE
jgi:hypothetical protein